MAGRLQNSPLEPGEVCVSFGRLRSLAEWAVICWGRKYALSMGTAAVRSSLMLSGR